MTDNTLIDREELVRIAEAALATKEHAQEWVTSGDGVIMQAHPSNAHIAIARTAYYARFIATFDPPTVLRLLSSHTRMEAERDEAGLWEQAAGVLSNSCVLKQARILELEAALQRLGSMEAFTHGGMVDPVRDVELIARIDHARSIFPMEKWQ